MKNIFKKEAAKNIFKKAAKLVKDHPEIATVSFTFVTVTVTGVISGIILKDTVYNRGVRKGIIDTTNAFSSGMNKGFSNGFNYAMDINTETKNDKEAK